MSSYNKSSFITEVLTVTITTTLLIFMGVLMVFGALKGRSRGIGRQAIRSVTVVLAVILSLVITNGISDAIYTTFSDMTPEEFAESLVSAGVDISGFEEILYNISPDTINYIMAIPLSLLIMPIVFVICFEVLKALLLIVHAIFSGICGFSKKRNNWLTRLLGAILGALQGVACAIIVSMPIVGMISMADNVVVQLKEESPDEEVTQTVSDFYDNQFEQISHDPMVTFFGNMGGKALYNQFAIVNIDGDEYNIQEEVAGPIVHIAAASPKLEEFDWKNLTTESKEGLFIIVDAIDESGYFKKITLDVIDVAVNAYEDGAFEVEADAMLVEVVDAAFTVFGTIDEVSFDTDIKTVFDAYAILGREGALEAFESGELEEVRDALISDYEYCDGDPITASDSLDTKTTVLKKVTEILNANPHTTPLVSALSRISVAALAQNFGSELPVDEIYDTVKGGLTTTLQISKDDKTEEEYKEEVKTSIDEAMKNVDIELEENVLENMADYVSENYETLTNASGDGEGVTDEQINEVILSYYDAYLATGELPEDLEDVIPNNPDDSAAE